MKMVIDAKKCCGCGLCVAECPCKCIRMCEDAEGFLYPEIDKSNCIDCGKCRRSCIVLNNKAPLMDEKRIAYAAINEDNIIRNESASGGVFTAIANKILDQGGVVFGAAFNDDFELVHTYVEKKEDLCKFRGSKYIQSRMDDIYFDVIKFLDTGRPVFFTGTPCQIAALKSFIDSSGKHYENLFLADLICHGVPSPGLWKKYINYRSSIDRGDSLKAVYFRNKDKIDDSRNGKYNMKFIYRNGKVYKKSNIDDPFLKAFSENLSLRNSCYNCIFRTKNRQSDITLGDFWWIENVISGVDDGNGVSLTTTHTKRGAMLLDEAQKSGALRLYEVDYEKAISGNNSMTQFVFKSRKRDRYIKAIMKGEDFAQTVSHYSNKSDFRKVMGRLYRKIRYRKPH